jgi:mycothiol system anti-sigma-R factor
MSTEPEFQQPSMWRADLPPMRINDKPLSCEPSFGILFQFLDGALDLGQQADVRQHLDDCPSCSLVYDAQAELKQALASSCRIDPPAGLADKVFAAVLAGSADPPALEDDVADELLLEADSEQMTTSGSDGDPATETETS